ncbi:MULTISPECIES: SMI1/KNR4 family protein [Janthinobacterium]|uniref:SMI1/KNR4 family protein n=1 Tax=Janthinobacterium TaxID=29580 RepID=UPI001C5A7B5C|nr:MULTISPECIES: SMI1/KNR4 family protein [Janthinobacterium]MBW3509441.1 SMI1/KNR4 family protein [Janthinobacterium sp. NKUCC06_STL]MCA1859560.1 SMI1/KNR4 family protein [Janthinobacterium lividum]
MKLPVQLEKLHQVADAAAIKFETSADMVFEPCGLILEMPQIEEQYWCTPTNVVPFASTGGDGVHYSYLKDFVSTNGTLPIIMTLPSADENNVVIAESFEEFFNLGYYVGWYSLEQLVYQEEQAIDYFIKPDEEHRDYAESRLEYLREALQMRPVPPQMARLAKLREQYFDLLLIPELPE